MSTYAEMERMTGPDALMLHIERPTVPMHTLKVVVLEAGRRGPLSLAELRTAVAPYLGLVATLDPEGVRRAPGAVDGRSGPPTRTSSSTTTSTRPRCPRARVTSSTRSARRLAERHLDRTRPLWAMTFVHGAPPAVGRRSSCECTTR